MKIKLVFDGTLVLNEREQKDYNIVITPFIINDNGTIYRDNVDVSPEEFYDLWRKNNYMKTSQPNIGETTELFKKLLEDYDYIIYFTLPEVLSGTYATGKLVAKEVDESRITVVDAKTGVGMGRIMAKIGNQMIADGKSVEEIVEHLSQAYKHSTLFVWPTKYDGLRAGGRISNISASIFGLIKMRICIFMAQSGYLEKFAMARTDKKILKEIIENVKDNLGTEDLIIYLIYSDDKSALQPPRELFEKEFPNAEYRYMPFPPTLGAHTGPDTISFHFCKKHW